MPYTFPLSPVVASCKTMVQYHNQDVDINTVKVQNISITTRKLSNKPYLVPYYLHNLLNPWQPLICPPHLYNFIISRILYKWDHIYSVTFEDWLFSFHIILLRSFRLSWVPTMHSFLMLSDIPWYGCDTICLTTYLLKCIWVVSS